MTQNRPIAGIVTYAIHTSNQGRIRYWGVDIVFGAVLFPGHTGNWMAGAGEFLRPAAENYGARA